MDAATLSDDNGAFYAPAVDVIVDGLSLVHQRAIGVSQIEVDRAVSVPGRFSFTVVDAYDLERRDFVSGLREKVLDVVRFGARVSIRFGYGDRTRLTTVLTGVVTEIGTAFSEAGMPELTVAGYDDLFPLTLGKGSNSWHDTSDGGVVTLIAETYGLRADADDTEQRVQIEQHQQSDFEFVKKLAEEHKDFVFYVDTQKTLRFGRRRDRDEGIVTLRWGESLLSFRPEANLARQVTTVEVHGWDRDRKQPIVGRATVGEESGKDPGRRTGGDRLRDALGKDVVLSLRQPVFTEAEAKERARSILDERAKEFVSGEFESFGVPDLVPDRNVILGNMGATFSKTYYLEQTVHKMDGSGYRTRARVKEASA
jgi:phage protein D